MIYSRHKDKLFTNGIPDLNFRANDQSQTRCCNSFKKYFLLEKFVQTDIENSENKNQSGILDQAVQRLFMSGCPEYLKAIKHKREAKRVFECISSNCTCQQLVEKENLKLAENKA